MTSGGGEVAWRLALSFDEHEVESMPLTPEDVSNKRFTTVRLREGYDMTEVDQFLDEVEAELERMTREADELRAKLHSVETGEPMPEPAPRLKPAKPEPKKDTAAAATPAA